MNEDPNITEKIGLNLPADYLGYTVDTQKILQKRGIDKIGHIVEKSEVDLLLLGIDRSEVAMIRDRLLEECDVKLETNLPNGWEE